MSGNKLPPTGARLRQAVALHGAGRLDEAESLYRSILKQTPRDPDALNLLGALLIHRGACREAVRLIEKAIAAAPRFAQAEHNLGWALQELGQPRKAALHYRRAIALDPTLAESHNNLGNVLIALGRRDEARAAFEAAIALRPDYALAHCNLGDLLRADGDAGAAVAAIPRAATAALAMLFTSSRHLADWSDPTVETRLRAKIETALAAGRPSPLSVFDHLHIDEDPASNRRVAAAAAAEIEARMAPSGRPFDFSGLSRGARRLRIGYVSYDFRDHTVGHMIGGSLAQFDRDAFEIIAYAYGRDDGSVSRRRIADSVDRFVDFTTDSFAAAAERIHRDGIDILVDLMGHTHNARLEIFALRPAPIQATWMGMAGTTGARFIDYCIADRTTVDESNRHGFTEAVVRLPHFWRINDRRFEPPPVQTSRAEQGLPADAFVFASFNSSEKLDPVMFAAWMRILAVTPGSVLWCRDDGASLANLRRRAAGHGVDPSRLVGMERVDHRRHIGRMPLADLALDTRLVNGHTTTYDALWAGVPVLALLGRHMPARVSASALAVAGLPELVALSLDDYEATALRLTRDRARWVRSMEQAFRLMWARYCAGGAPVGFDVPDDLPR